jgi:hypothetical protein
MARAQAIVLKVDAKSAQSVQECLAAVEQAYAACEKAKLGPEREQLLKAKNELRAQLDLLETRARRKKPTARSKEELAQLAKTGDPGCPKGQAYKPRESPREIRCVGPQMVDMSLEALKGYYEDRRFKLTINESPAELRAELGSELYVFTFDRPSDSAARCVTAYAAPGMSWQELTSRLTGISPEKLKLDGAVPVGTRELPLKVENPADNPTVRLGACPNSGQAPTR